MTYVFDIDGTICATQGSDYEKSIQLTDWKVQFHKLMLGKPAADFYIDDKAINDGEFFEK